MATTTMYGIAQCDTIKKARRWLDDRGVVYDFHDFKKQGVPATALNRWAAELGWEALVNRRGTTWRRLDDATRESVVDVASALAMMMAQPSVIKRPVMVWPDKTATVGFDEAVFAAQCPA